MKNFEKENNNNNIHYFIPCYDIINNEIYFSDFFTEEIISKPPELKQKQKDYFIAQLKTKLDQNKTNINNNNKENKEKKLQNFIKNEKNCLDLFKFTWKKIQILSGFNTEHFISENFEEYFKRPFFSRFLISENLQLYSYNSCNQLPNVIASYLTISVNFDYHLDSLFNTHFEKDFFNSKNEKNSYNLIKYEFDNIKNQFQNISLFYSIDTLIKDTINTLIKNIDLLINKYSNTIQIKDNSFNSDNIQDDLINKEEICNLLQKFKENLYKHLNSKSDKFILKVAESEEYLYGDFTLGQYDFVRYKVRQHESITLILKVIPFFIVQPPLFSFPPILIVYDIKNVSYEFLFDLYVKLYPNHEIIYRLFKPDEKSLNKYLKNYDFEINNNLNIRQNRLNKFNESSDCDFPFSFTIVNIKNVYKFKNWFDNELYNKNELVLPYINPIKK